MENGENSFDNCRELSMKNIEEVYILFYLPSKYGTYINTF